MRWVRPRSTRCHSCARNDARQQIVGENPLSSLLVAVNREGDALVQKRQVCGLLAFLQLFGGKFQKRTKQCLIVRAWHARGGEHLIVSFVELVIQKWRRERGWRGDRLDSQRARSGASLMHS